jgi:hypothetical protein
MKRLSKTQVLVVIAFVFIAICSLVMTSRSHAQEQRALYLDASQPIDARVEDLLSRLTLEEKLALVHADSKFTTAAIPRLGLPRRWLSDAHTVCAKMLGLTPGCLPVAPTILPASCRR